MYYSFNGLLHPVVEKPLESTATALHPLPKKSPENTQKIQFHSEKGSKATQKVDLFAEQNAKQAEKQKEQKQKRKKIIVVGSIISGIIIAAGIALAVMLLIIPTPTLEEESISIWTDGVADDLQKEAKKILAENNPDYDEFSVDINKPLDVAQVEEFFGSKIDKSKNSVERNNIMLVKMTFFADYAQPRLVIESGKKIDISQLTDYQLGAYCSMMYNAYVKEEQFEQANYWYNFAIEKGVFTTDGAG